MENVKRHCACAKMHEVESAHACDSLMNAWLGFYNMQMHENVLITCEILQIPEILWLVKCIAKLD